MKKRFLSAKRKPAGKPFDGTKQKPTFHYHVVQISTAKGDKIVYGLNSRYITTKQVAKVDKEE